MRHFIEYMIKLNKLYLNTNLGQCASRRKRAKTFSESLETKRKVSSDITYLEVVEKKMNCTPRTWVGYSVGDKISKMSLLSTKIERRVCRMSSVLCMWLSSQRAGGVLERSLLSASREGVTAATRTAADPKSGPALKPCRLSLWWAGGIYSKLIKMLTKRILLLSNCFWSGKIWTGWD